MDLFLLWLLIKSLKTLMFKIPKPNFEVLIIFYLVLSLFCGLSKDTLLPAMT